VVVLGVIGDKARATLGRTRRVRVRDRIVRGGRMVVVLVVADVVGDWEGGRVAKGTDLDVGWCGHGGGWTGEGEEGMQAFGF
jgi:hypothetical protein